MAGPRGARPVADAPATPEGREMNPDLLLLALLGAAAVAILALLLRLRRERSEHAEEIRESPIAMSSEGVKLCPSCATENLWTDTRCLRCGRSLPDAQRPAW